LQILIILLYKGRLTKKLIKKFEFPKELLNLESQ
jgi:hypothetical protein